MKLIKGFSAAVILLTGVTLSAQNEADNTADKTISFGVKGGVNFATVSGADDSPAARTSFHVGALVEFPMSDMFSLQTEVLYSGQGFEYDNLIFEGDHAEYQLDYLNIPVLAKIYATKGLSFEVGPQFGFVVNEEIDYDPNDNPGDFPQDQAESFDFSIAGGVSFQTEMGLFATGRYTYGLTDVIEDSELRNSVFQIGIGYKF